MSTPPEQKKIKTNLQMHKRKILERKKKVILDDGN